MSFTELAVESSLQLIVQTFVVIFFILTGIRPTFFQVFTILTSALTICFGARKVVVISTKLPNDNPERRVIRRVKNVIWNVILMFYFIARHYLFTTINCYYCGFDVVQKLHNFVQNSFLCFMVYLTFLFYLHVYLCAQESLRKIPASLAKVHYVKYVLFLYLYFLWYYCFSTYTKLEVYKDFLSFSAYDSKFHISCPFLSLCFFSCTKISRCFKS